MSRLRERGRVAAAGPTPEAPRPSELILGFRRALQAAAAGGVPIRSLEEFGCGRKEAVEERVGAAAACWDSPRVFSRQLTDAA